MKPTHSVRKVCPAAAPDRARYRGFVGAAALVLGLSLNAAAQEADSNNLTNLKALDLEQLLAVKVDTVYAASKFEQKITEAPSSVSVVSSDEIKLYGYRTLGDILESLQGFYVSHDRNYGFLGARGVNLGDFNSRMLLLIDGHRANNDLTDGAFIDTAFLLDVDLIDRVEVVRGPGSVLYGNNAFFGVINVIPRKGRAIDGVEASGEYAQYDTYKGRVTIGKSFTNGLEFMLSGTYYQSAGPDRLFFKEFDTPENNNGIASHLDDDKFASFFGTVSYGDFSLQGGYISREKGNPTAQFLTTFNDPRLRTTDDRYFADLKFAHEFPGILDVTARLYYDGSGYKIGYPFGEPVATSFFQEVQHGQWWGAELQLSKRLWEKHIITAGAEYRDDFDQTQRIFDTSTTYTDVHTNRTSYGFFVQGDFEVMTNLHLNAGVRYDQTGDFDPSFSPRAALIYSPFQATTFKFLYGTAFRAPNFLELSDPRFQNIKSEDINSYELIYEQGFGRHLHSSLSGFYNQMHNLIVFENGSFDNVDADTRGMEAALEGTWASGIRGRASFTLQKTERESGAAFSDSPEELFKLNLSVPLLREKIFASLEYQYTSSRHTVFTSGADTLPGMDTAAFGVVNFTIFSRNLIKNLEISGSIYNLLDQSYADPSTRFHMQDQIPQDGRSFRVKLTYRF